MSRPAVTAAAGRRAPGRREDVVAAIRPEAEDSGKARRRTELGLILLSFLVIGGAYTLASLGRHASLPANVFPFLGVVAGLVVVAHLATRRLAPRADPVLLPLAALLNGLGYVFIARLDESLASKQAGWTAIGIGAYVLTLLLVRRVRDLHRYTYTFGLLGVVLLMLPLVPGLGVLVFGAKIWVRVGPFTIQPGEFAKILLALFFAAYLVDYRDLLRAGTWRVGPLNLPAPRYLAPVLAAWAMSLLVLMFERDLGSALLFFALFLVMIWIATERLSYVTVGMFAFLGGAYFAWWKFAHVRRRVTAWLDPWSDPSDAGYQIIQGHYALAWGGLGGTGLGLGQSTWRKPPAATTDMILAVIGEELGLFGTTAVLAAYLLIAGAGFRIAMGARDPYLKLVASGLTTLIAFQAFVIMAGVIRLLPLTGVTLPFLSYGGSSLVANYVLIALLARVGDEAAGLRLRARTRISVASV